MKKCFALSVLLTLFVGLVTLAGCGPTRKEYAINEALLMDQTRVLEDQLYRANYRIQRLEKENEELRAQVEKGKNNSDDGKRDLFSAAKPPVPATPQNAVPFAPAQKQQVAQGQPLATQQQPTRMAHTTATPPRNLR